MAEQPEDASLEPCSICSRTFRPEILERHVKVCEKTLSKKRKVFDSFKNRVQGTELEEFLGPAPLPGQAIKPLKSKPSTKSTKWRQTHESLLATLRAARGQEPTSTAVTTTSNIHTDTEQCPTCGRHFGPRAYDRHVEFCRELMSRKPKTIVKNPAQQRMEARTRYKAPLVLKKSQQNPPKSVVLPKTTYRASNTASIRSPSSQRPATNPAPINRSTTSRASLRLRNVTSAKPREQSKTRRVSSPEKLPSVKNTKPRSESAHSNMTYSTTMQEITAAAEQQMRDLLSWPSDSNLSAQTKPIHSRPKLNSPPHSHSSIHVSPTSAFTPVSKTDDLSLLSDGYTMLTSTPKKAQTPLTVRKTDVIPFGNRIVEIDEPRRRESIVSIGSQPSDSTLADEGIFWANLESMFGNKKIRKKTLARSKSVFEDRNRMLFLQTYDPELTSSEDDDNKKRDGLISESSFLTYPEHCYPRPGYPADDDEVARDVVRAGGDSAYSSLNRHEKDVGPKRKVSTFCHECGSKFPLATAKFCCECGIRRLLI